MTFIFMKNIFNEQLITEDISDYRIWVEVFKYLILNWKYFKGKVIIQGDRFWTEKEKEEKTIPKLVTMVLSWLGEYKVWFLEEGKVLAEYLTEKSYSCAKKKCGT